MTLTANPSSLGEWATLYANRGWPVLPLRPGSKVPATSHGVKDATRDLETIRAWWWARPNLNIGIATGAAFDALDVDYVGWEHSLDAFGIGPTVVTPSGGYHVYVSPGGGNRVRFMPGADWRGSGGYVVAPPSWSAEKRAPWRWAHFDLAIPPVPGWLQAWLRAEPPVPHAGRGEVRNASAYGEGALRRAERRIKDAPIGQRNSTLNRIAWSLTELVAEGHISLDDLCERLGYAAQEAGLPYEEVKRTLWSAIKGSPWL